MNIKIIAILLSCVMLTSISPAVAAEDAPAEPKPTVDEILNEYHLKSFEARFSTETDATTYSNRSSDSSKSLEQETVETLTAAGYEAYNVTAENFNALESLLATDFAEMGMEKEGSYIVVIGGDELFAPSAPQSRSKPLPEQDHFDDGGSSMEYTYNGKTYTLRYMIVTSADNPLMSKAANIDLTAPSLELVIAENILNAGIGYILDQALPGMYLGTILSLCGVQLVDFTPDSDTDAELYATAKWTRLYTQVWDESWLRWKSGSMVEYAAVTCDLACTVIDQGDAYVYDPDEVYFTLYTEHYNDLTWRKREAVIGAVYDNMNREIVGDISITINSEVVYTFNENF